MAEAVTTWFPHFSLSFSHSVSSTSLFRWFFFCSLARLLALPRLFSKFLSAVECLRVCVRPGVSPVQRLDLESNRIESNQNSYSSHEALNLQFVRVGVCADVRAGLKSLFTSLSSGALPTCSSQLLRISLATISLMFLRLLSLCSYYSSLCTLTRGSPLREAQTSLSEALLPFSYLFSLHSSTFPSSVSESSCSWSIGRSVGRSVGRSIGPPSIAKSVFPSN